MAGYEPVELRAELVSVGLENDLRDELPTTQPVVLHVCEAYGGGVMNVIHDYIDAAPDHRHVILRRSRADHDTGSVAGRDIQVIDWPSGLRPSLRVLAEVMQSLQPDIVHAHSSIAGALVRLSSAVPTHKIFYTPHCFAFERRDIGRLTRLTYLAVERVLARRTAHYVAVSPRELDLAVGLHRAARGSYVPNIVRVEPPDLSAAQPRTGAATVVTVGRISEQKDPAFFADVVRAAGERTDITWLWLGDGPAHLVEPLRAAGVQVSGWLSRAEVFDAMRNAAVYLHTASWEGAPLSILEAAALDLPLVVRDTPATESLALDDLVGTPAEAADAVLRRLQPHDCRPVNARLLARHTADSQRAALLAAYETACRTAGTTRRNRLQPRRLEEPYRWPPTVVDAQTLAAS
jgi:glycosyltransferase involved in cell wall biosynthesis